MTPIEVTQRYYEAWNGRDADALVATFTKDGTYCSPDTYPGVSGEALANFVKDVWTALPDFSVRLLNAGEIEPGVVAHHSAHLRSRPQELSLRGSIEELRFCGF
jgi:hypothetical protein